MMTWIFLFLNQQSLALPKNPEAVIQGSIKARPECSEPQTQVWLAEDKTLIYQIEVPPGGTFKLHVVPGSYRISANNSRECFALEKIDARKGMNSIELRLAPVPQRNPAEVRGT